MSSFTDPSNLLQALPALTKPAGPVRVPSSESTGKIKTAKSRKRVNTAEKRASHNAVERQRREALNGRFLDLARLLPSLATARRPSKSAIVNGSISYVTMQRAQRLLAARELRALLAERDALLTEVNDRRALDGLALATATAGLAADVDPLFAVEDEVFGTFADGAMGGDHGDDDDLLLDSELALVATAAPKASSAGIKKKAGSVALSDDSSVAPPATATSTTFHPDFASQSFSSDGSSFFEAAYRTTTEGHSFFGAGAGGPFFPKLEAMTPPSSDSTHSPLSSSARMFGSVDSPADEAERADKVSSWAAEQLFAHIQAQQHQHQQHQQHQQQMASPTAGLPFFHGIGQAQQQPTLAGQHHAQNPFTASLLANIAATQQHASAFGLAPLYDGVDGAGKKSYDLPFTTYGNGGGQQLDAWRSLALAQHTLGQQQQQQQQHFGQHNGGLSVDHIKHAVRAGVDFGMSLNGGMDSFN